MFEAIEQQENKKKKEAENDKDINLLPKDLKNQELKELKKTSALKKEQPKSVLTSGQPVKKEQVNYFGSLKKSLQNLFKSDFSKPTIKKAPPIEIDKKKESLPLIKPKEPDKPVLKKDKNYLEKISKSKTPEEPEKSNLEVNLLPAIEGERIIKRKRLRSITVGAICEAAFLVFLSIGLLFWSNSETNKTNSLREERDRLTIALKKAEAGKKNISLFKQKISELEKILAGREEWTLFFKFLEDNTVPNVYYDNLDINNNDGAVTLQAKATDIDSLAQQIVVFQEAEGVVKTVTVSGLSFNKEDNSDNTIGEQKFISFTLQLIVEKKFLLLQQVVSNKK